MHRVRAVVVDPGRGAEVLLDEPERLPVREVAGRAVEDDEVGVVRLRVVPRLLRHPQVGLHGVLHERPDLDLVAAVQGDAAGGPVAAEPVGQVMVGQPGRQGGVGRREGGLGDLPPQPGGVADQDQDPGHGTGHPEPGGPSDPAGQPDPARQPEPACHQDADGHHDPADHPEPADEPGPAGRHDPAGHPEPADEPGPADRQDLTGHLDPSDQPDPAGHCDPARQLSLAGQPDPAGRLEPVSSTAGRAPGPHREPVPRQDQVPRRDEHPGGQRRAEGDDDGDLVRRLV